MICYDKYHCKHRFFFFVMYERLTDLNNLYSSFQKCKRNVDWKCSVQRYEANLLVNLNKLKNDLENHTYKQKPFHEFDINERGKIRHIKSLHISDRVLQRALCDYVLIPELSKYLIYDNGASVKGKGVDFARKRLKVHLEKFYRKHGNNGYVLLIDFKKYFDSIPHRKLIEKISEKIKDKDVMNLVSYLIGTFKTETSVDKSVGIGSQISQIAGIFYPTQIDNYCKIVKQCKFYGRYMDDTYVIHESKEFLKELLENIKSICKELDIIINTKKTQIIKLSNGFTFLKMRYIFSSSGKIAVIPVKKSITRERRKLNKLKVKLEENKITLQEIQEQYKSWKGNILKYNAFNSVKNIEVLYKINFGGINGRRNEKTNGKG